MDICRGYDRSLNKINDDEMSKDVKEWNVKECIHTLTYVYTVGTNIYTYIVHPITQRRNGYPMFWQI